MSKNTRKQKRNQTTMYLCISKANQDFFDFFISSFEKLNLSFPSFARAFENYLLATDITLNPQVTYAEDEVFDWCNYAKKIYYRNVKTIDYGTACVLTDFFASFSVIIDMG